MTQQCAHDVHLRMTRAAIAALHLDFFKDGCCARQRQTSAAIFLWNEGCEIAFSGQRFDKFGRIFAFIILGPPIFARIFLTQFGDLAANVVVGFDHVFGNLVNCRRSSRYNFRVARRIPMQKCEWAILSALIRSGWPRWAHPCRIDYWAAATAKPLACLSSKTIDTRLLRGSVGLSGISNSRAATPSIREKRSSLMPLRIKA